jgi:D-amino-acid oxidase
VLLEAGYDIEIWTEQQAPDITSSRAGAVWYPHFSFELLPETRARLDGWLSASYHVLIDLAVRDETGCILAPVEARMPAASRLPSWAKHVPGFKEQSDRSAVTWTFDSVIVDVTRYMPYLWNRIRTAWRAPREPDLIVRTVTSGQLWEILSTGRTVINCTGLGARELVGDVDVYPERGQTAILPREAIHGGEGLCTARTNDSTFSYLIPRRDTVVLGGTSQRDRWDAGPDPADRLTILENCAAAWPELRLDMVDPVALQDNVGLRPKRAGGPRVEREQIGEGSLIHNYGHGHNGFNLSWGCAAEVLAIVQNA